MLRIPPLFRVLASGAALASALAVPTEAQACGGFFCSSTQPVNQAAERIIFADNGDGTVTAVIQILYEGPAEKFSWLLPISSVPKQDEDIGIASNVAFQRLQTATNPQYNLRTRVEGSCSDDGFGFPSGGAGGAASSGGSPGNLGGGPPVVVEATGIVGAFEWAVISLNESLEDPADAAATWLTENGYDVPEGAKGLLRPYLEDGLYLLALRLTKGVTTGSIRPISLTYDADKPMIPIKLTAVAANENMGVMTWVLSKARAVPQNYYTLELNEARINWFNANSNYNDVVNEAADAASGHGFVTELAGATERLKNVVWTAFDESSWEGFRTRSFESLAQLYMEAQSRWGTFDGFQDVTRSTVELPEGVLFSDLQTCPSCYADQIKFSPTTFIQELDKQVMAPMRSVQELVDRHPYVTRLYTTMSAQEMTQDPLFTFNPDLPDVDNVHTADRVIECSSNVSRFEAPFRIELPQGGVIRGTSQDARNLTWPTVTASLPANRRILQLSSSGEGRVVEDNSAVIQKATGNRPAPGGGSSGGGSSSGGSGGNGTPVAGSQSTGGSNPGASAGGTPASSSGSGGGPDVLPPPKAGGSGCSVAAAGSPPAGAEWLFAGWMTWLGALRRRRSAANKPQSRNVRG